MPKAFDFGSVNLTSGEGTLSARPVSETPFRIAILGDFSGRSNRGISDAKTMAESHPLLIDRDNFDEVLSRVSPELDLAMGDGSLHLRFSELEDFHPDRIFHQLEAFARLRDLRGRLDDPSTFQQAADELGLRSHGHVPEQRSATAMPAVAPNAARLASASLLDEMIEQTESRIAENRHSRKPDEVREFAQRVAAENLVDAPDARQPEIVSVIDRVVGGLMRAVLHNPDFQALEAAWRATFFLVRQLETGSRLKLYLIDISRAELAEDLNAATDLRHTGTYRLLVEQSVETVGAEPWAVIVGNFGFGSQSEDPHILRRLAAIASRAGAPFLAEADSRLLGCASLAANPHPRDWNISKDMANRWAELRRRPEAGAVGLALPRFLLRLPYGKKTVSVESFDFEEFPEQPVHEDYLWGNPAFALALLLAQSVSLAEGEMSPGMAKEIEGLPLHIYRKDGDSVSKPCAETLLTDEAVERLLEEGLIPVVSVKNRDAVWIPRFQSISSPPQALAGDGQSSLTG
jgi:type VI secretion system protein ImpC